jgi:hypothetical protein
MSQMSSAIRSLTSAHFKKAGRRVVVKTLTFKGVKEPRLRFDKTALGLVKRLESKLAKSIPDGRTVVTTITAPIRQDSKTGSVLEGRIQELLATGRGRLKTTIYGNRIQVRVLKGGATRTTKLIGFVHNPQPNPEILFDVIRSALACIGSNKRSTGADRWLIITNQHDDAPVETIRQVCLALRARTVFKRILLAQDDGFRVV